MKVCYKHAVYSLHAAHDFTVPFRKLSTHHKMCILQVSACRHRLCIGCVAIAKNDM